METHTNTPWTIGEYSHPDYELSLAIFNEKDIEDPFADVSPICVITPLKFKGEQDQANAEFIVKACNNHDKLVEGLKVISKYPCISKLIGEKNDFELCSCARCIAEQSLKDAGEL